MQLWPNILEELIRVRAIIKEKNLLTHKIYSASLDLLKKDFKSFKELIDRPVDCGLIKNLCSEDILSKYLECKVSNES